MVQTALRLAEAAAVEIIVQTGAPGAARMRVRVSRTGRVVGQSLAIFQR